MTCALLDGSTAGNFAEMYFAAASAMRLSNGVGSASAKSDFRPVHSMRNS